MLYVGQQNFNTQMLLFQELRGIKTVNGKFWKNVRSHVRNKNYVPPY